jgi:hypothetical protein
MIQESSFKSAWLDDAKMLLDNPSKVSVDAIKQLETDGRAMEVDPVVESHLGMLKKLRYTFYKIPKHPAAKEKLKKSSEESEKKEKKMEKKYLKEKKKEKERLPPAPPAARRKMYLCSWCKTPVKSHGGQTGRFCNKEKAN